MSSNETDKVNIGGMGSEIYLGDKKSLFTSPENETGWDRIKMIYTETGSIGPGRSSELQMILFGTTTGCFTGALMGFISYSKKAKEDFIRKNKDQIFLNPKDAQRKYIDNMILESTKGALRYATKMGLFAGGYCGIATLIATYRNAGGFLEHVIAGTLCGSIFKMSLGPKGMIAGGILGMALGTAAGTFSSLALWASGTSISEIRYWQHNYFDDILKMRQDEIKANKTNETAVIK